MSTLTALCLLGGRAGASLCFVGIDITWAVHSAGRHVLIAGSHHRLRLFLHKLLRGESVTISAIGGSSELMLRS